MKEKNSQGFQLYSLLSEADEKFVAEALDDSIAEDIRAKNRRKMIRMRSALAACAAVVVLVVGLSVMPKDKLEKSDSANYLAADDVREKSENTQSDTVTQGMAQDKTEENTADTSEQKFDDAEQETEMFDGAEADEPSDEASKNDEAAQQDGMTAAPKVSESVQAGNGITYQRERMSSEVHMGKFETVTDSGTLYEFDNFPTNAIALLKNGDTYELVVNSLYTSDTLGGVFRDFGFRHYLHCDGAVYGDSAINADDYVFQSEVWGKLFQDPENCKFADTDSLDEQQKQAELTFNCRLSSDDELYCYVKLELNNNGFLFITISDVKTLCFECPNAAEIISTFTEAHARD